MGERGDQTTGRNRKAARIWGGKFQKKYLGSGPNAKIQKAKALPNPEQIETGETSLKRQMAVTQRQTKKQIRPHMFTKGKGEENENGNKKKETEIKCTISGTKKGVMSGKIGRESYNHRVKNAGQKKERRGGEPRPIPLNRI